MTVKHRRSWFIFIGLFVFFQVTFAVYGLGIYNDSQQYITMHVHREPLYPLFLALFRWCLGEERGLAAAAIVQNALLAVSIFALTEYLADKFSLKLSGELILTGLLVLPQLMTRFASALGIFLENSVMSEALCIPLFHFFILFMLKMLYEAKPKDMGLSLLFAFLLSMTRSQMFVTYALWLLGVMLILLTQKKYKKIVLPIAAVICAAAIRHISTYTYNYFITGYFMGNTYGQINLFTNVLYACDPEDGEVFEDGSLEREFFDNFYEAASALSVNYRYAGETISERTEHIEGSHDILKFQVIDDGFSNYYLSQGEHDYYRRNILSDNMASSMRTKLLPVCFGQWLYDYLLLCRHGFIRSIAVVHPLINWIALGIYMAAIGFFVYMCRKEWKNPAVWLMGLAFLFIIGNVCGVALTIMCLSRYMVYGFSLFYIALFLLVREFIRERSNRKYGLSKHHI